MGWNKRNLACGILFALLTLICVIRLITVPGIETRIYVYCIITFVIITVMFLRHSRD
jgi:hypothetical protein